ncbi:zonular occludens toxin family protein [Methylovulum psychrotolerans]|uniref:Zonular occludens toxin n=1 Tax=Methylovulum psychrotolerans TaxID=1704499 RepID=A0A2S5CR81_9GAMM|nr:zonular occludens toxin domain-containing protein [Methylovulum psychrotolerans]POZ53298.1 Zonular occludens toxin [Methylovulum psychrotolerans]
MLIFHEGLPGSGKSYSAAIDRIIPALKKGRKVYAYIEGINHEKFAEVTGLALPIIKTLLFQIEKEQVPTIYEHVANDSLVIIDELQDFFPVGTRTLSKPLTEFVTQHRHRGIDIIGMGQNHKDCHQLWKRRIDQLVTFTKRDAVGFPNQYTFRVYKQDRDKFTLLTSGGGKYDPKYFGLYKSHSDGVDNTATYSDDRANILKSKAFRVYLPLFLCIVAYAVYYLSGIFTGRTQFVPAASKPAQTLQPSGQQANFAKLDKPATTDIKPPPPPNQPPPVERTPQAWMQSKLEKYRARLVGLIENKDRTKMVAWVEFVDDSNRVYERFDVPQLQAFGYTVERKAYGLLLTYMGKQYPVTAFPIDRTRGVTTANGSARPPASAQLAPPVHF